MAITRENIREEAPLITGPVKVRMVAVSPTKEEAAKLGVNLNNEPNYLIERDEELIYRLDFYLEGKFVKGEDGKLSQKDIVMKGEEEFTQIFRLPIFISDRISVSSGKGKLPQDTIQFINIHGQTSFIPEGGEAPTWFDTTGKRPAYRQEATLYEFLIVACKQNTSKEAPSILMDTTIPEMIEGNLDELKSIVEDFSDNMFYVLVGVNDEGWQEVYKTPASSLTRMKNVIKKANDPGYPWNADFSETLSYYVPTTGSSETATKPELDIDYV
ncbi:MAG TPA: hypothetical protein PKD00_00725 [Burkholderiales bacterium]|nr:hypothetical protein [Burkholderiales bacterium]